MVGHYIEKYGILKTKASRQRAQTITEMALLFVVIALGLLAMTLYMKRALQGKYRGLADEIGEQYAPALMHSHLEIQTNSTTESTVDVSNEGLLNATSIANTTTNETVTREGYEEVQGYANETMF